MKKKILIIVGRHRIESGMPYIPAKSHGHRDKIQISWRNINDSKQPYWPLSSSLWITSLDMLDLKLQEYMSVCHMSFVLKHIFTVHDHWLWSSFHAYRLDERLDVLPSGISIWACFLELRAFIGDVSFFLHSVFFVKYIFCNWGTLSLFWCLIYIDSLLLLLFLWFFLSKLV